MNPGRENHEAQRAVLRARHTASQERMSAATKAYRKTLQLRGLVISHCETPRTSAAGSGRAGLAVAAVRGLIPRLTRGRLTDAHDQVLYVIRKPEDRLARVV